jgi:hypothetical protein
MTNTTEKTPEQINSEWLDSINSDAEAKAKELSVLMNCIVTPIVFVVEEGKDAAVGYVKKPDAATAYKMMLHGRANGIEKAADLLARAQLVRDNDIKQFNPAEGVKASDVRLMDAEGKYDPKDTDLNLGLLVNITSLISPLADMFKKK